MSFADTPTGQAAVIAALSKRINTRERMARTYINATHDLSIERAARIDAQHEVQRLEAEIVKMRADIAAVAPYAESLLQRAKALSLSTKHMHRVAGGKIERYEDGSWHPV